MVCSLYKASWEFFLIFIVLIIHFLSKKLLSFKYDFVFPALLKVALVLPYQLNCHSMVARRVYLKNIFYRYGKIRNKVYLLVLWVRKFTHPKMISHGTLSEFIKQENMKFQLMVVHLFHPKILIILTMSD